MKVTNVLVLFVLGTELIGGQTNMTSDSVTKEFSNEAWQEDFHQLITEMDSHYADLDWAVNDRHMNLPKLRADTEEKIRQSHDEQGAKRAIEQFLSAFGDGHLSVAWSPAGDQKANSEKTVAGEPLCSRLGFRDQSSVGIDFSSIPGFEAVAGEASQLFPGGILTVPNGKVGTIRVYLFDERGFPRACEEARREMHLQDDAACDSECEDTVRIRAADFLTDAIIRRANQLRSLGASAILVDVTRNNGGDDWNEAVARTLSRVRLIDERRGFIRHPAWTQTLARDLRKVQSDLNEGEGPTQVLKDAATKLQNDIELSKETCDRSTAFLDGSLHCSLVVDGGLFWSGVLPYAKPGSFARWKSKTTLFNPLQYVYSEGALQLPLFVAVDGHSWSSAERFAALLQDNGAATIIGELTGGAGCGFVNGGIPTTLMHSEGRVKIPNCVGFRADGSNANAGVTPDILLPWAARDTAFLRANKARLGLIKALSSGANRSAFSPKSRPEQSDASGASVRAYGPLSIGTTGQ